MAQSAAVSIDYILERSARERPCQWPPALCARPCTAPEGQEDGGTILLICFQGRFQGVSSAAGPRACVLSRSCHHGAAVLRGFPASGRESACILPQEARQRARGAIGTVTASTAWGQGQGTASTARGQRQGTASTGQGQGTASATQQQEQGTASAAWGQEIASAGQGQGQRSRSASRGAAAVLQHQQVVSLCPRCLSFQAEKHRAGTRASEIRINETGGALTGVGSGLNAGGRD